MPTIDGIELDNPTFGWVHRATSEPLPSYENDLSDLKRSGRDGVVPVPGTTSPVLLRIVVQTPRAGLESLTALFRAGKVWGNGGREAAMEFRSVAPTGFGPADQLVDATFVIRLPGAFMRATAPETTLQTLTAATHTLSCFAARPAGQLALWRNLLTNPSFEMAASTTVVRTQRIANPNFEVDTAGWTPANAAALSRTTAQAHRGTASMQIVTPGTVAGEGAYSTPGAGGLVVTGQTYSAALWVLAPAGAKMEMLAATTGSGGNTPLVRFDGTGSWQYIKSEGNLPATGLNPYLVVRTSTAVAAQAITFYVDEAIMEYTPTIGLYFDGASQPILRTNRHIWPVPTTALWSNSAGTGGAATGTVENTGPGGSPVYVQTMTAAPTGGVPRVQMYSSGPPITNVTPGDVLPISVDVSANHAKPLRVYVEWYTSANAYISGEASAPQTVSNDPANPTRIAFTPAAAPANAGRAYVYVAYAAYTDATVGSIVRAGRPLVGATGAPFTGASAQPGYAYAYTGAANASPSIEWDADFSTRWQGTANASLSELTGVGPATIVQGIRGVPIQSTRWAKEGTRSIRIGANLTPGQGLESHAQVGGYDMGPFVAGQTYTLKATFHQEVVQGSVGSTPRSLLISASTGVVASARASNTVGDQDLTLTFTVPSTATWCVVRFTNWGDNDVWWDLATLVVGTYTGPAFTGATVPPDRLNTIAWGGLPDQSPSTWTVFGSWDGGLSAPIQDAVLRVKGPATGIQVTDSSGAWAVLPDTPAGTWTRFEADTGQCFQTATDTWSGGVEVSGAVDYGGPRGVFEITPVMALGDPGSRSGQLTVATATRPGAPVFEVRGKPAYLL